MVLFFISFLLIFLCSYFTTAILTNDKSVKNIFYFIILFYANIVFTMEVLSIFSAITPIGVLILNILLTGISTTLWLKKGKPRLTLDIKPFILHFKNAIKSDKCLMFLLIGFIVALSTALISAIILPVNGVDAEAYHVIRSLFWISNHNLAHFTYADARAVQFPINSELVYAWIMLFCKKVVFIMLPSFFGYFLSIVGIYGILSILKYSMRKKLWVIFILSSMISVMAQMATTETDIIISGLVLASIYLFWIGIKNNEKIPVYISSLAFALAIGTKTTSFIFVIPVGLMFLFLGWKYKNKEFYKPFITFLGFSIINFLIFASYNYILNFIDYGCFMGSKYMLAQHENIYGIRGIIPQFIKYLFMFIDFSGFKWNLYLGPEVTLLRDGLLQNLNMDFVKDGIYSQDEQVAYLIETNIGLGILGILVYLPCWIRSLFEPIFKTCKKEIYIFTFGTLLLLCLLVMSYVLIYMSYSIRFFTSICVVSAPVLVYSYRKKNKFSKILITFFALLSLILFSGNLASRPIYKAISYFKSGYTLRQIRKADYCSALITSKMSYTINNEDTSSCFLRHFIKENVDKKNKILLLTNFQDRVLYTKMLDFEGYNINYDLFENIENIDLNQYNVIIFRNHNQESTIINQYNKRKPNIYLGADNEIHFRKNNKNRCYYLDPQGVFVDTTPDNIYPYYSSCEINNDYLNDKQFRYAYSEKLKINSSSILNHKYKHLEPTYYIYENINNPMFK